MELLPSKHITSLPTTERKDVYEEAFNRTVKVLSVQIT